MRQIDLELGKKKGMFNGFEFVYPLDAEIQILSIRH
jgi:hypothetical protein